MAELLLLAALLGAVAARPVEPADTAAQRARRLVLEAARAVEGDSAPPFAAVWSARLGEDSTDRDALLALATVARLSYDDSSATRLYRRLLRTSRSDEYALYAQLGLARLLLERAALSASDSAARAALAAARALPDRAAEGEAFLALADGRMDEDAAVGRAYLDSALRVLPPASTELAAEVRCRRARLAFRSGDPRFPAELAAALPAAHAAGARRAESQCLRTAAADLYSRGLTDSAAVLLRRSADLQRGLRDRRSLAFSLTVLADVLRDQGAYGEARTVARDALEEARAARHVQGEALATQMSGTLAYSLRDLPTARRAFDRADSLYGTLGDSANQMNVRSWQANIARDEGDLARARRLTHEVIAEARREQAVPWAIDLFESLADLDILAGDFPSAAAALDTVALLQRHHGTEAWPASSATPAAGSRSIVAISARRSGSFTGICVRSATPSGCAGTRWSATSPTSSPAGAIWPAPSARSPPRATRSTPGAAPSRTARSACTRFRPRRRTRATATRRWHG